MALGLITSACGPTEPYATTRTATVDGQFSKPDGLGGAAWLFLYRRFEGPPGPPAVPAYATAISALRLDAGDARFVFAQVKPDLWRLYGLLDVDGNFDPQIDVLAQPTAGDRVGEGVEVNVQPGRGLTADYAATAQVEREPPAFVLDGVADHVTLSTDVSAPTVLTLVSDAMGGRLDPKRTDFTLGLVDADHDGRPDDADGDGVPDLSLQLFLRWVPLPGVAPEGSTIIIPLVFNPAPFLLTLNGNLAARVSVGLLQATLIPQAQVVSFDDRGRRQVTAFGAPPSGDYELIALGAGGQFWRVPNQLSGQVPSQGVRLHYDRTGP